ncbi:MAG TPA: hypothetical protein VF432_19780 [Thermoanaerobaculia bacterium]
MRGRVRGSAADRRAVYADSFSLCEHFRPVREHSSPVLERSFPVLEHFPPVREHSSPVPEHSFPVREHFSPVREHSFPVCEHLSPVREHFPPLREHFSPVREHSAPVPEHFSPVPEHFSQARRSRWKVLREPPVGGLRRDWVLAGGLARRDARGSARAAGTPPGQPPGRRRSDVRIDRAPSPGWVGCLDVTDSTWSAEAVASVFGFARSRAEATE